MTKKIVSILLAVCLLVVCLPLNASAAGGVYAKLNSLRERFPNGGYWNHQVTTNNNNGDQLKARRDESFANTVTSTPCATHNGTARIGQYDCNYFDGGLQCWGFACKLFYEVFGVRASSVGKRTDKENISVGDYIRIGTDADGHSAIVLSRSGNTLTLAECNVNSNCYIMWGRQISLNTVSYFKHAPNYSQIESTSTPNFKYWVDNVSGGTGAISLKGWVYNESNVTKSIQIHAYIDGGPGSGAASYGIDANVSRKDVDNVYHCGEYHGFSYTIKGVSSGSHVVQLFAVDQYLGTNTKIGDYPVTVSKDTQKPTISNIKVTDITKDGYTVSCTVSDNVAVTRVEFPTWTLNNDQDDLIWHKGTINGNTASYRVKISEHKNETNCYYVTHIYAWDAEGNTASASTNNVYVGTVSITGVTLNNPSLSLKPGESATLTATITPANATDKTVTWSSSNTKVATVNNGKVTAVAEGTATITAKAGNQSAPCIVTVKNDSYYLDLNGYFDGKEINNIAGYGTADIYINGKLVADDCTDYYTQWPTGTKYEIKDIKALDGYQFDGVLSGALSGTIGNGMVKVYLGFSKKSAEIVTLTLNQSVLTLQTGESATLIATVTPNDATDKTVTWSSSDTSVATVYDGKVNAVGEGTARITATAGGKTAVCSITVGETPLDPTPENSFIDVPNGAYYAAAVNWAVDQGVTAGTSKTTFSPNQVCTRAQAVTFLWRAAGSPEPRGSNTKFNDVAAGQYYTKAVQWAVENGITGGTSTNTFSPNDKCTRAQIVTFQYRMHGSPSVNGISPFTDVPASLYYASAVAWAVENGITSGTSASTFSPHNDCSRGQIITFLYRDLA